MLAFGVNVEPFIGFIEVPDKDGTPFRFPKGAALRLCCFALHWHEGDEAHQATLMRPWV